VEEAARDCPPLSLRVEGLGVFPNASKARVLWAGLVGDDLPRLVELRTSIASAVAGTGYPVDDSVFHPHVTLGRVQHGRLPAPELNPVLNHYRTWSAGSFSVPEVVTFASTITRDGPAYAPLGRSPLRGRKRGSTT
jgi:2'-5' RNA ligase